MKKILALIAALILIIAVQKSFAQDATLVVTVTDKDNGDEPIVGAIVTLRQNGNYITSSASDVQGLAKISGIDPGKYRVHVGYLGHTAESDVNIMEGVNRKAFSLGTRQKMHEITIEAEPEMFEDGYGGSTSVFGHAPRTTEAIAVEGTKSNRSLNTAIAQPGTTSTDGGTPVIRGGRTSGNLTLIDGIPVRGSLAVPPSSYGNNRVQSPGIPARYSEKTQTFQTQPSRESYKGIDESTFKQPLFEPLSTFSIDVDGASYTNTRRFIRSGQIPPGESVRIEEFINYFDYDYAKPEKGQPFGINTEMASSPWDENKLLIHVGIQGKSIDLLQAPPSNLVFLIDVSGSMGSYNKLPLVKNSLQFLVDQLRDEDQISLVVYAGSSGLVLDATPGSKKREILSAIDRLSSGGSTAGGAGIELAYKVAVDNFIEGGNNRVILATDGDFNVGTTSEAELQQLIEKKRESGVFLTTLGYGTGNYQDSKMEMLANKGNGNYYYIDQLQEAQKVFGSDLMGTLFAIAKDVKIQVEFNPLKVASYRLIGYENRALANEDFNDDTKDAGELGSGHTVTALYEIVPTENAHNPSVRAIDPLRYQNQITTSDASLANEYLTIKLRYKLPDGDESTLISEQLSGTPVSIEEASENLKFSASVAAFGMALIDSEHLNDFSMKQTIKLASSAKGKDDNGHRAECIQLMKLYDKMEKLN